MSVLLDRYLSCPVRVLSRTTWRIYPVLTDNSYQPLDVGDTRAESERWLVPRLGFFDILMWRRRNITREGLDLTDHY